ncbi:hypothetical protein niasHT_001868 [Heterodera trifolii]|uniref:Uncharacterized protein n=1 Tax=Heterodera trifolii TaxID=157864 RepID=A0ABD2LNI4_9BILA
MWWVRPNDRPKPEHGNAQDESFNCYPQWTQRSYLLDFKNLVDDEKYCLSDGSASSSRHASVSCRCVPRLRTSRAQSLPMPIN